MSFDYDAPLSAEKVLGALRSCYLADPTFDPDVLYARPETLAALAESFYPVARSRVELTPTPQDPLHTYRSRLVAIVNPATGTEIRLETHERVPVDDLTYSIEEIPTAEPDTTAYAYGTIFGLALAASLV